jgi:hypothetical protein
MPGKLQQKIRLNSEPQDYEASINTILRYVEKNYNHLVGPTYWLLPSVLIGSGKTIILMFDVYQKKYNVENAFTDIARFVSIDVINEISNGKKQLDIHDFSRIIHLEFRKCKEIEEKNGGIPLEVKATDIRYPNGLSMLPFPLILPSTSYNTMMPVTEDGNPSDATDILTTGIVAELQKE